MPMIWGMSRLTQNLALPTQPVDLQLDDVTGPQVGLGIGLPQPDASGGAGIDEVAGLQHHELAQISDDLADAEDHVLCGAILARFTVDPQAQSQRLRILDFIGGDQPRAQGVEGLAVLALVPGALALELELPL